MDKKNCGTVIIMYPFAGEKINSNLTRVVVVMWLVLVFVLTSSYTANLSSMLTVQQLKPDVGQLKGNSKVGCDGDSFVKQHLVEVLGFKAENVIEFPNGTLYHEMLQKKKIAAAFLELPHQKVFLNKYCNGYTAVTRGSYRFGGLGFVSNINNLIMSSSSVYFTDFVNVYIFIYP